MKGKNVSRQGSPRPIRRSIRLPGYDYSRTGAYFVTICTKDRKCLFGDIINREMVMSDAGRMVQTVWDQLSNHYPGVETDVFQIMPNHIHGIIVIRPPIDQNPVGATPCGRPVVARSRAVVGQAQGPAPTATGMSLPDVVHRFKTLTTKRYIDGVKQHGWPPFPGKLWQRNYYEHIIRNDNHMALIRKYITTNPTRWTTDPENPLDIENPETDRHEKQKEIPRWLRV